MSELTASLLCEILCTRNKVKLCLCLTNEAVSYEGEWGAWMRRSRFLDFGSSWTLMVSFKPRAA
jgi:hypothetical protein